MNWFARPDLNKVAHLIRVESALYSAGVDETGESCGPGRVALVTRRYPISSYTAQGAWIDMYGEKKFVNLRAVKQYANAHEHEAKEAFKARKERQIRILENQLRNIKHALWLLNENTN